jgi:hypothetical protein
LIPDFTISRLRGNPALIPLADLLHRAFTHLAAIPHFLRPCYFELLFTYFYTAIEEVLLDKFLYDK